MTVALTQEFLLWCTIINCALLTLSLCIMALAHDWVYRMHSKWFKLSVEQFSSTIYALMGFYKVCIILFNVAPLAALYIATR